MSINSPFEAPTEIGDGPRESGTEAGSREADQRKKTIRLVIIGLVAGTSLGYLAVSMRNGDLSWIKNLGSGGTSTPGAASVP